MTRWEYKVVIINVVEYEAATELRLKQLGTDGWELAAVVPGGDGYERMFLKRAEIYRPECDPARIAPGFEVDHFRGKHYDNLEEM